MQLVFAPTPIFKRVREIMLAFKNFGITRSCSVRLSLNVEVLFLCKFFHGSNFVKMRQTTELKRICKPTNAQKQNFVCSLP